MERSDLLNRSLDRNPGARPLSSHSHLAPKYVILPRANAFQVEWSRAPQQLRSGGHGGISKQQETYLTRKTIRKRFQLGCSVGEAIARSRGNAVRDRKGGAKGLRGLEQERVKPEKSDWEYRGGNYLPDRPKRTRDIRGGVGMVYSREHPPPPTLPPPASLRTAI